MTTVSLAKGIQVSCGHWRFVAVRNCFGVEICGKCSEPWGQFGAVMRSCGLFLFGLRIQFFFGKLDGWAPARIDKHSRFYRVTNRDVWPEIVGSILDAEVIG